MAKGNGPIVVCVINLKGGVGKSTIAALLSRAAYWYHDLDVLAVDLDPQANLSQGLMHNEYAAFLQEKKPSIVEVFNGYMPPSKLKKFPSPLAGDAVAYTVGEYEDHSLQIIPSRFDFSDNLIGAVKPDPRALAKFLSANFSHKDLIVIDCAPTESILTHAAYHASSRILVPVKPEFFATIGFPLLRQSIEGFLNHNRSQELEVCGVVINNAFYHGGNDGGPEKARAMREIEEEAKKNKWPICERQIPHSRGFPKLMRGDNSHSGNAYQFWAFADQFLNSIGF